MLYLLVVLDRLSWLLRSVNVVQAQLFPIAVKTNASSTRIMLLTILKVDDRIPGVV